MGAGVVTICGGDQIIGLVRIDWGERPRRFGRSGYNSKKVSRWRSPSASRGIRNVKIQYPCRRLCRSAVALAAILPLVMSSAVWGVDPWAPPASYYNSATGTGSTLKSQLYNIMKTGQIQRTYGDFRYSAAIHDQDPSNPSHILLVYDRTSVSSAWDAGSTWNREHVWPQSLQPGSVNNSSTGNLGDPHALRPANPGTNSSRSNDPYGFATTTGNNRGLGGGVYYPGDEDRGDIARQLFYSDTRWGPELGLSAW